LRKIGDLQLRKIGEIKFAIYNRQLARRELLEGIMPSHSLWNDLKQLHSEFHCVAKELAILTKSEEVYKALADLDILLNTALQKRYKIETRDDLNSIPYWRDFRNQFVHSYPGVGLKGGIILDNDSRVFNERVEHAKRRAHEARGGISELELVMETLCTPLKPR